MSEGRLISFEGVDGAGKSTQVEILEPWLKAHLISYVLTCEPGGTALGIDIRKILLRPLSLPQITSLAEVFLFQADRAQHFAELIIPALEDGKLVITDRCFDASIAYQGYARGVDVKLVERLSMIATHGRVPDLTILLDLDPSKIRERINNGQHLHLPSSSSTRGQNGVREEPNRLDTETLSFHQRAREGYLALASAHPDRIKVVDASRSPEEIHKDVVRLVESLLKS